jgi:hypothetical protein
MHVAKRLLKHRIFFSTTRTLNHQGAPPGNKITNRENPLEDLLAQIATTISKKHLFSLVFNSHAGKADYLITEDKNLLNLNQYKKTKIVTVNQMIDLPTWPIQKYFAVFFADWRKGEKKNNGLRFWNALLQLCFFELYFLPLWFYCCQ